jgi:hypothetical protein
MKALNALGLNIIDVNLVVLLLLKQSRPIQHVILVNQWDVLATRQWRVKTVGA